MRVLRYLKYALYCLGSFNISFAPCVTAIFIAIIGQIENTSMCMIFTEIAYAVIAGVMLALHIKHQKANHDDADMRAVWTFIGYLAGSLLVCGLSAAQLFPDII